MTLQDDPEPIAFSHRISTRVKAVDWSPYIQPFSNSLPIVLAVITIAFVIALNAHQGLRSAEVYNEFIAGSTTFSAESKSQDSKAVLIFIAASLVFLFAGSTIHRAAKSRLGNEGRFGETLFFGLVPGAIWFGPLLIGTFPSIDLLQVAGIALLITFVFSAVAVVRAPKLLIFNGPDRVWAAVRCSILIPLFLAATPFALNVLTGRVTGVALIEDPLSLAGILCAAGVILILLVWTSTERMLAPSLRVALMLSQLPLIGLFFVLLPPTFVSTEGPAPSPVAEPTLYILIAAFVIYGVADIAFRFIKRRPALSPAAIGGMVIFFTLPLSFAPGLNPDDYHYGEYLYPWWSFIEHGALPYVDHAPAHGLMNYLPGTFADIFFDGTAASFPAAQSLVIYLFGLAIFWIVAALIGAGLAWVPILFIPTFPLSWSVTAVFFGVILLQRLRERLFMWLLVWVCLGVAAVFLAPAQGAAFVLATIPFGLYIVYRVFQEHRRALLVLIAGIIFIFALLAIVTPLPQVFLGMLQYVIENSSVNEIAYGLPWRNAVSAPVMELTRMGWVFIPVIAIWFALEERMRNGRFNIGVPFLIAVFFPVLILGYTMGRIDPGHSRMGYLTVWLFTLILPMLLIRKSALIFMPLVLTGFIFSSALFRNVPNLETAQNSAIPIVGTVTPFDMPALGFENIGHVLAEESHIARLTTIKRSLDENLEPDEPYLDMTGRGAHYFYFQRPSPIEVGSPYNMAHPDQQLRSVERLNDNPPRMALLAADNIIFDGASFALRSHLVFRWIVENYIPVEIEGYVYGVVAEMLPDLDVPNDARGFTAASHTDVNWANGIGKTDSKVFFAEAAVGHLLEVGDNLEFAGSGQRAVTSIENGIVFVDGALDADTDGYPNEILIPDDLVAQVASERLRVLFDRVYRVSNLRSLPISWGRSIATLQQDMDEVRQLDVSNASLNQVERDAEGAFIPTGADPYIIFDVEAFEGRDAGLLTLMFRCVSGAGPAPVLQVFWSEQDAPAFNELASVSLNASNGALIVPLDSQPRWLLADAISQIRIDLDDPAACARFWIDEADLSQRSDVAGVYGALKR